MYVSSIHLLGTVEGLPPRPFDRLRLIFLDLHLSGAIGKDAASYTANVFRKVVSADTAPVVVVIWSKYAGDKVDTADIPREDQETEAQLFKRTLLGAEPKYVGRLIFVEMNKPKQDDRPRDWAEALKTEISKSLDGQSAVELLWAWEGLVTDGCAEICRDMTLVAQSAIPGLDRGVEDGLKASMQHLAKASSAGDFSCATAPKHLLTVLTQLLTDRLEHPTGVTSVACHGTWLGKTSAGAVPLDFAGKMNGLLLTSDSSSDAASYVPGTVFRITDPVKFPAYFGKQVADLLAACFDGGSKSSKWPEWNREARPVLIELSPVCDVAQGYRVNSLLIGGVVAPARYEKQAKRSGDAFGAIAKFHLRWALDDFQAQDVVLSYCHRYKTTLPAGRDADWLKPWFRLKDLPLTAIRNSNAAHGSRVGYVSLT